MFLKGDDISWLPTHLLLRKQKALRYNFQLISYIFCMISDQAEGLAFVFKFGLLRQRTSHIWGSEGTLSDSLDLV